MTTGTKSFHSLNGNSTAATSAHACAAVCLEILCGLYNVCNNNVLICDLVLESSCFHVSCFCVCSCDSLATRRFLKVIPASWRTLSGLVSLWSSVASARAN